MQENEIFIFVKALTAKNYFDSSYIQPQIQFLNSVHRLNILRLYPKYSITFTYSSIFLQANVFYHTICNAEQLFSWGSAKPDFFLF